MHNEYTTPEALLFDVASARLDHFDLKRRLGRRTSVDGFYGVNSSVYLACLKARPEFYYAVKIYINDATTTFDSEQMRQRFSEFAQCRRLPKHNNVVDILSVFISQASLAPLPGSETDICVASTGSVVVVMELLPCTLAELITERAGSRSSHFFEDREILTVAVALLQGVEHINTHRFVHRDLKPDNVLVSKDFSIVRITDLGCSLDCDANKLTGFVMPFNLNTVSRGGAPAYWAPEIAQPHPGPDVTLDYSKSDVFAVGLILYAMLSLEWPFESWDAKDYTDEKYREPPMDNGDDIRRFVTGLLQPDPTKRLDATAARTSAELIAARRELMEAQAQVSAITEERNHWRHEAETARCKLEDVLKNRTFATREGASCLSFDELACELEISRIQNKKLQEELCGLGSAKDSVRATRAGAMPPPTSMLAALANAEEVGRKRDAAEAKVAALTRKLDATCARLATITDSPLSGVAPLSPVPIVTTGLHKFGLVTVDQREVFAADSACVSVFDDLGRLKRRIGLGNLTAPRGCAVVGSDVFVADASPVVATYPRDGGPRKSEFRTRGTSNARLAGVAQWGGRVFLTERDGSEHRVSVFGTDSTFMGHTGKDVLVYPTGICASEEHVFVVSAAAAESPPRIAVFHTSNLEFDRHFNVGELLTEAHGISAAGGLLFVAGDDAAGHACVAVLNAASGECIRHLVGFSNHGGLGVAVRPSGEAFVTTDAGHMYRVDLE